jgi:hypothetical protein
MPDLNTTLGELAQMIREEAGQDHRQIERPAVNAILQVAQAASGDFMAPGEFGEMEPRRLLASEVFKAFIVAADIAADMGNAYAYDSLAN